MHAFEKRSFLQMHKESPFHSFTSNGMYTDTQYAFALNSKYPCFSWGPTSLRSQRCVATPLTQEQLTLSPCMAGILCCGNVLSELCWIVLLGCLDDVPKGGVPRSGRLNHLSNWYGNSLFEDALHAIIPTQAVLPM